MVGLRPKPDRRRLGGSAADPRGLVDRAEDHPDVCRPVGGDPVVAHRAVAHREEDRVAAGLGETALLPHPV